MNSIGNSTFISIVIPVYNAEDTIEELVDRILEELKHDQYFEIVLVNDGSTDASEEVCINSYNKNRKEVKFLSLSRNFGEHNAVMAGLNHVSGDYVVIMDDDFQNPVSEVTKLIVFAVEETFLFQEYG
jgi:undecaprenyl-phosphate 4-deoxy-4-formamido-L-arabinose transferase